MNKFSKAITIAAALASATIFGIGCKSSTEPSSALEYGSEAAADVQASSIGTESGGAGVSFGDAMGLVQSGNVPNIMGDPKSDPQTRSYSFDSVTKVHTLTITRGLNYGNFNFSALITYQYTFYDASGNKMNNWVKGTTDKVTITLSKTRSLDKGERVDVDDTASGSWIISNIVSGAPLLNGSFMRNGTEVFHTPNNGDRTFTQSLTINFTNDTLVQDGDKKHAFLKGPASSDFSATTPKYSFSRHTDIVFNGDGTATLTVHRADGTTDVYTVDTRLGLFLHKIR